MLDSMISRRDFMKSLALMSIQLVVQVYAKTGRTGLMNSGNQDEDFEARRQKLLDVITSQQMAKGSYNSGGSERASTLRFDPEASFRKEYELLQIALRDY